MMFNIFQIQYLEAFFLNRVDLHWDYIDYFRVASIPDKAEPFLTITTNLAVAEMCLTRVGLWLYRLAFPNDPPPTGHERTGEHRDA